MPETHWTHPSVIALSKDEDPVAAIIKRARQVVMDAVSSGWAGPPFDPVALADKLGIEIEPSADILDARTMPVGKERFRIEYNPNMPRRRIRYSIAHELAHTLFPDCAEYVRHRCGPRIRQDDWQLETLCNLAASEFLMPLGSFPDLHNEQLSINHILVLRDKYDVSMEALLIRAIRLTASPCAMFTASRINPETEDSNYRVDYSICSPAPNNPLIHGIHPPKKSIIKECTAIGYTAIGKELWGRGSSEMHVECVGLPPHPRHRYPRVAGLVRKNHESPTKRNEIIYVKGDATDPRGNGRRIIVHVVNDRTSNWGGRGFAIAVRRKWKDVQDEFSRWAVGNRNYFRLGNIHQYELDGTKAIIHMIAQHGYGISATPRIKYAALEACLNQVADIAVSERATIHMPRIGCGEAGGDWGVVEGLISGTLLNRGLSVYVYDLPTRRKQSAVQTVLPLTN